MEQVSVSKRDAPFERNMRRMLDGKDTILNYYKDTNDYIGAWKRLYLLDSDDQQKFFWSNILAVCTCMKYIDIEFENQMVSFAFERAEKVQSSILNLNDFQDVQREILDTMSWDGFLIPPTNLFQTNDVRIDENDLENENWNKEQGYATVLQQYMV